MIFYTLIYSIATLGMIISGIINSRFIRNTLAIAIICMLVFLSGTRYHLGGYDYANYDYMFQNAPTLDNLHLIEYIRHSGLIGTDIGWTLINSVVKSLGFNFYGLTLFVALFFWFTMFTVLKSYMVNVNVFIVIAMYKYLLDVSFIYMRQSIAVAIFLISLKYILRRQFGNYLILIILAATVHFSAMVLLPIYWICQIKISKRGLILYSICFSLSFLLVIFKVNIASFFSVFSNIFSGSGSQKITEAASGNLYGEAGILSSTVHLFEFLVIDYFLIKNFDDFNPKDSKKMLIIKLYMILLPIYSIFATSAIMVRYGFYFLFTYAVIIDALVSKKSIVNKIYLYVLIAIVSFAGMYKFVVGFDNGADWEYDSFVFHNQSIRGSLDQ